jgi:hypothetical protein
MGSDLVLDECAVVSRNDHDLGSNNKSFFEQLLLACLSLKALLVIRSVWLA